MRIQTDKIVELYQTNLFQAAFAVCKDIQDAQDAVQETFLAYHTSKKQFESEQHLRNWLIRVAINKAKNSRISFWRQHVFPLDDYLEKNEDCTQAEIELLSEVLKLPDKYRIVVHLFYYEDYSISEISKILHRSENTVKTQLSRGRSILKKYLTESYEQEDCSI